MPTLDQNIDKWDISYDWTKNGDEWSVAWGGTENLWWWVIYPRIANYIKCKTILEIAPGRGRFTQYLKNYCEKLYAVDISANCIEYCKKRFSGCNNISFFANDGKSLDMIEDNSIDFAFSFDSLVHAEFEVIDEYLKQLSKKLTKNGIAFIHHSNRAMFASIWKFIFSSKFPFISKNTHWRATSVSAKIFSELCEKYDLKCISQELVNWGGNFVIDSFSVFASKDSKYEKSSTVYKNFDFMKNSKHIKNLSSIYH
jgi:ubiquinone/menaquinone biosynthesis C-methylase UbiE